MWLLDTRSYQISHFVDGRIPKYAILSHTWDEQEVSFTLMKDAGMVYEEGEPSGSRESPAEIEGHPLNDDFPFVTQLHNYYKRKLTAKLGWSKITRFCQTAREKGFRFGWVDTCCINKDSSAELQEAINSMFKWYSNASICLVYMKDVLRDSHGGSTVSDSCRSEFRASRWFTRGWTLQELLAPEEDKMLFLDQNWKEIGTDQSLRSDILFAAGIGQRFLPEPGKGKGFNVMHAPIAEKMSWASKRTTTRGEDMAYCLLGIFCVSMPLIYGEGGLRAFQRLQLEILNSGSDDSLFAWNPYPLGITSEEDYEHGMLATSPEQFIQAGNIGLHYAYEGRNPPLCWKSNRGLEIELNLKEVSGRMRRPLRPTILRIFIAPLRCWTINKPIPTDITHNTIFIYLGCDMSNGCYYRLGNYYHDSCDWSTFEKEYPAQKIVAVL